MLNAWQVASEPNLAAPEAERLLVDWDVPIPMDDGLVLSCDIFRPLEDGRYPVLLSYGPYGKGLPFQIGYESAWSIMVERHPEVAAGSSNRYQNWEVVDPEKWVPNGYVCVRVDSRGAGRSPGKIDPYSPRETRDLYDCIEWAANQEWSNGNIGLAGVSYYAINQWHVAALAPPHLKAIAPWEGANDFYREMTRHGGIYCTFLANWYDIQVASVQHGLGNRGPINPNNMVPVCGDAAHDQQDLEANRVDLAADSARYETIVDYHRARSADLSRITVPLLSAGNWGGHGLHLRGNVEGFTRAKSPQKWLEIHGREHWTEFYTDYGVALQREFFDHFLKEADNGWDRRPPVMLRVRTLDGFVDREEHEWPLARTDWTKLYLDAGEGTLEPEEGDVAATIQYESSGDGVTFRAAPFERTSEITGPMSCRLFISTDDEDADLFLVVRVFDPAGDEVLLQGAIDPQAPLAQGWLRASHRKLDHELSTDPQPVLTHDEIQPLVPGQVTELHIEIWPTSLVIPPGYRIGLTVRGSDFDHGQAGARLAHFRNEMRGCGPFIHDQAEARTVSLDSNRVTIHTGPASSSHLLVPFIPTA